MARYLAYKLDVFSGLELCSAVTCQDYDLTCALDRDMQGLLVSGDLSKPNLAHLIHVTKVGFSCLRCLINGSVSICADSSPEIEVQVNSESKMV